jgi:hypothetical protein
MLLGALAMWALPRAGVVNATQELIALLALVMAGLLPAMILTATIMRSAGYSAKRIAEYGGALKLQLRFWAILFIAACVSCLGIVGLKIFSSPSNMSWGATVSVLIAGAGFGAVVQRMLPAYHGLVSLLDLNVQMAKNEAAANDRILRESIEREAGDLNPPKEYRAFAGHN